VKQLIHGLIVLMFLAHGTLMIRQAPTRQAREAEDEAKARPRWFDSQQAIDRRVAKVKSPGYLWLLRGFGILEYCLAGALAYAALTGNWI